MRNKETVRLSKSKAIRSSLTLPIFTTGPQFQIFRTFEGTKILPVGVNSFQHCNLFNKV